MKSLWVISLLPCELQFRKVQVQRGLSNYDQIESEIESFFCLSFLVI